MIDYAITTVDYGSLPAALLPIAKQHMRVDFTEDDQIITRYIAAAIQHLEQFSGWRIFAANVVWFPVITATAIYYQTPVAPVREPVVKLTDPPPATDISADFILVQDSLVKPAYLVRKDQQPFPAPLDITLQAGYLLPDDIPPMIGDLILRIAGTYYENRESVTTGLDQMPFWMNDLLSGIWVPRC